MSALLELWASLNLFGCIAAFAIALAAYFINEV